MLCSETIAFRTTKMKFTISICAYNRPNYLQRVLERLLQAQSFCHEFDASVHLGIDPNGDRFDEVLSVARSFPFVKDVIVWPEHHGVSNAPRQLLQYVFTEVCSDFNLHLEDDTLLSPDALRLCLYFATNPRRYWLLSLHARSNDLAIDRRAILPRQDFGVWGWAAFRSTWTAYIAPFWNHLRDIPHGWDYSLTDTMQKYGLTAACPALSRVHNIGREGGAHQTSEGYDQEMAGLVHAGLMQMCEVKDFYYAL